MCSKCQDILLGFSIPHIPTNCPLLQSSHCAICASYTNHTTEECPDHDVKSYRKVTYVEQLIPHSLLSHYNITTRTPILESVAIPGPKYEGVLELEDTDKAIRQVLMNYNIQPSGRQKENRRRIKCLADELGRKLVYFTPK